MTDSKIKTRTVSFRIPEHIIAEIEREAKTKLTSTNGLINQILSHYVLWGRYEHQLTMYPVPPELIKLMLNVVNEKLRGEMVDIIYNNIRDWALTTKKKFDIHTCLQVLEDYCEHVGILADDSVEAGIHTFTIRHNLGTNSSKFIAALLEKIFFDLAQIRVDCQLTKNTVICKLHSKF